MAQLSAVRRPFRALANVFIPETAGADDAAWNRLEAIVAGALAPRSSAIARQVLLFIGILEALSVLRHGRGLASLDMARRTRLVESIATSRVLLLRRGIWGLRTLVQMGWYAQPEVQRSLGYRATAAGWEAPR
ncbi:MAG TPA: hypothetical protein VJU15_14260 [Gemmatimonadales bacterium]|nr:hypothetical protein [Gemmatimonadales bacterium]